jgi:mannosyltransferase
LAPALKRKLALVLLLAAALRLLGLSTQSLWSDEGVTLLQAGAPSFSEVLARVSADTHPPLYFLMLHAWIARMGSSEAALRLPSVLAGLATFPLLARLLLRMGLPDLVLPTLCLLATSAFHCQYSQEARSHVFAAVLATGSMLAAWRVLEEPGRRSTALFVLLLWNLLGLYFNPFFPVFWVVSCLLVRRRTDVLPWLMVQLASLAAFLPHLLWHWHSAGGFASQVVPGPLDGLRLIQDLVFCHNYPSPQLSLQQLGPFSYLPGAAAFALSLMGFAHLRSSGRSEAARWLLLWFMGPILLCFGLVVLAHVDLLNFKYFLVCLPPILALIASGLLAIRPWLSIPTAALLVGMNLVSWSCRNFDTLFFNQDWRGVGAALRRQVSPGDLVIVQPQMMAPVFQYYFGQPCPVVAINEAKELDSEPRCKSAARIWVVTVPAYRAVLGSEPGEVLKRRYDLTQTIRSRSDFASEVLQIELWFIKPTIKGISLCQDTFLVFLSDLNPRS